MMRALVSAAALSLASVAQATPAPHPDFTGLWLITTGETRVVPKTVEDALTPEAKARMANRLAQIEAGFPQIEDHLRCLPAGMPQMMASPFAIQIMQKGERILLNAEVSNLPRTIFIGAKHPAEIDPSWNGHSAAHWEGATLVIDTTGFNDGDPLDFNFDPVVYRTQTTHVVERWTLEKGGKLLVNAMTLDDPKAFTHPVGVTYRYDLRPADEALIEKVCEVDAKALTTFEKAYPRAPKYKHPF